MKEFSVDLGSKYHFPRGKEAVRSLMHFDLRPASIVNWIPREIAFFPRSQEPRAGLAGFCVWTVEEARLNFAQEYK